MNLKDLLNDKEMYVISGMLEILEDEDNKRVFGSFNNDQLRNLGKSVRESLGIKSSSQFFSEFNAAIQKKATSFKHMVSVLIVCEVLGDLADKSNLDAQVAGNFFEHFLSGIFGDTVTNTTNKQGIVDLFSSGGTAYQLKFLNPATPITFSVANFIKYVYGDKAKEVADEIQILRNKLASLKKGSVAFNRIQNQIETILTKTGKSEKKLEWIIGRKMNSLIELYYIPFDSVKDIILNNMKEMTDISKATSVQVKQDQFINLNKNKIIISKDQMKNISNATFNTLKNIFVNINLLRDKLINKAGELESISTEDSAEILNLSSKIDLDLKGIFK